MRNNVVSSLEIMFSTSCAQGELSDFILAGSFFPTVSLFSITGLAALQHELAIFDWLIPVPCDLGSCSPWFQLPDGVIAW